MLLAGKTAVVHGAGGVVGCAVAQAFARDGARVFLAGRSLAKLEATASSIRAAGGTVDVAQVDALDERAVADHAQAIVDAAGTIDVTFNAVGRDEFEIGKPLVELSADDYVRPLDTWARTHFITATAAARHMVDNGGGVILTLSSSVAQMPRAMAGGFLAACTSIESLTQQLAAELGPQGIRVVCLRPAGILESARMGSITRDVWGRAVQRMGMTIEQYLEHPQADELLPHSVTLEEVGNVASFLASDRASAVTATVANVSCGAVIG